MKKQGEREKQKFEKCRPKTEESEQTTPGEMKIRRELHLTKVSFVQFLCSQQQKTQWIDQMERELSVRVLGKICVRFRQPNSLKRDQHRSLRARSVIFVWGRRTSCSGILRLARTKLISESMR